MSDLWIVLIMPVNEYKAWRSTSTCVFSTAEKALKFVQRRFDSNDEEEDDEDDSDQEDVEEKEKWTLDNYRQFIPDEYYCSIDNVKVDGADEEDEADESEDSEKNDQEEVKDEDGSSDD